MSIGVQGSGFRVQGLLIRLHCCGALGRRMQCLCRRAPVAQSGSEEVHAHGRFAADSFRRQIEILQAAPRRDGAVRAVGFEDDGRDEFEGPTFAAQQAGGTADAERCRRAAIMSRANIRPIRKTIRSVPRSCSSSRRRSPTTATTNRSPNRSANRPANRNRWNPNRRKWNSTKKR